MAFILLALGAGCGAPGGGEAGNAGRLYVADAAAPAITSIDVAAGRVAGHAPLPGGATPQQLAVGAAGSLLVLSTSPAAEGQLLHVQPAPILPAPNTTPSGATGDAGTTNGTSPPPRLGGWRTAAVPLNAPTYHGLLAADGGRWAAVVHDPGTGDPALPAARCILQLVDVPARTVARRQSVCAPGELARSLALSEGQDGQVVYLGIQGRASQRAQGTQAGEATAPHRLIALEAASGAVVAVLPLSGPPGHVLLAGTAGGPGRRLYVVEVLSGPEQDPPGPQRSRLLGLNPATLEAETEHPLRFTPSRLAFAPHGGHAYALSGNAVIHLDLATGRETTLLSLPEPGIALAVSDPYLFVAQAYSGELWAVDRRRGRPARRLAAGRHPVAMALVSAT